MMIELRTGCRLHFGLAELSPGQPNRYAGLGVMLNSPSMHLRITWDAAVPDITLVEEIDAASQQEYQQRIQSWQRANNDTHVELLSGYPFHSGLGAGTQLACLLAVARQLRTVSASTVPSSLPWSDARGSQTSGTGWMQVRDVLANVSTQDLAGLAQRGLRSAIGLQGFFSGGLILDQGYEGSDLGSIRREVSAEAGNLPECWRFVLIRGTTNSAITGALESNMIGEMASNPHAHRSRMLELAKLALAAARNAEFQIFCDAMDEYMQYAGDMFAPIQGGRYNGAVCSQAVAVAKQCGLKAVGQSSWGPTIFGISSDPDQAGQVAQRIRAQASNWQVQIAVSSQGGAEVRFQ
ncbi:MAG: hypothetical protein U0930_02130 [Pirellulales bacterium]